MERLALHWKADGNILYLSMFLAVTDTIAYQNVELFS
jgi:hypothetical protein